MSKAEEKRAAKLKAIKDKMATILINTLSGKRTLYHLCYNIGVEKKKSYYDMIEMPAPKEIRTINNPTVISKVVHDYGLVFADGFEIRHVDKRYWQLFDVENIEVHSRKE